MRITTQNGKRYRAYSPEEFFKSPESPQPFFNLDELKPKRFDMKHVVSKTNRKSE